MQRPRMTAVLAKRTAYELTNSVQRVFDGTLSILVVHVLRR